MQPESDEEDSSAYPPPVVAEIQPGAVLGGRYRVLGSLGVGGMGVVYRVNQIFVDKQFALKTIDKHRMSELTIRRFQQEARTAFALDHPNIIAFYDFGLLDDQTPFLVMEMVNGETLGQRLKRAGCLKVDEAIPIFMQVCLGLAYAHQQGIVHRDIKPNNIMLLDRVPIGEEGSVKIVDFGIAKFTTHEGGEIQALTQTGEVFGSPLYMSPEQCSGAPVDYRSDIYSLGCVLFEALTGAAPCVGESALTTMLRRQTETAPTLRAASSGQDFPQAIETIVATMLAKSPERRYQSLNIVAQHLAAAKRGENITYNVKPFNTRAQASVKVISMSAHNFYALLTVTALLSAALAGVSGYWFHYFQNTSNVKMPAAPEALHPLKNSGPPVHQEPRHRAAL